MTLSLWDSPDEYRARDTDLVRARVLVRGALHVIAQDAVREYAIVAVRTIRREWPRSREYDDAWIVEALDVLADSGFLDRIQPDMSGPRFKIPGKDINPPRSPSPSSDQSDPTAHHVPGSRDIAHEQPRARAWRQRQQPPSVPPRALAATEKRPRTGKGRGGQPPKHENPAKPEPAGSLTDAGIPIDRALVKAYVERMRKAGAREVHFIQVKDALGIASRPKLDKLRRILQGLAVDGILVRKGSTYVIVG